MNDKKALDQLSIYLKCANHPVTAQFIFANEVLRNSQVFGSLDKAATNSYVDLITSSKKTSVLNVDEAILCVEHSFDTFRLLVKSKRIKVSQNSNHTQMKSKLQRHLNMALSF